MFKVLLVDDDIGQLRSRELILQSQGLSVHSEKNASSALEYLRQQDHISLVITDHNLAGYSGADLVRELRSIVPELPVLVLSGMPDIEDDYAGLDVCVREKPLPPAELIELVKVLVNPKN